MTQAVDTPLGPISPGMGIPTLVRKPGFEHWNRYAAVNDEFVPIHMDDEAGKAAGLGGAFGMGNLQWSYLHNLLESWIGENGRVTRLACQFRSPNVKGQTVTAHGRVTEVRQEADEVVVDLEVWTDDQDGSPLAPGTATVVLGSAVGMQADLSRDG